MQSSQRTIGLGDRATTRRRVLAGAGAVAMAGGILGGGVRAIAGTSRPLVLTSSVRDERYQALLVRRNIEATRAYSLHTSGWAFDIARSYANRKQALAFQYLLDRLTALDLIAWVREPGAIHVTVAGDADRLLR